MLVRLKQSEKKEEVLLIEITELRKKKEDSHLKENKKIKNTKQVQFENKELKQKAETEKHEK